MKRLIFCFAIVLFITALLAFPVNAQTTRSELTDVYESLVEYIYPPYYESSTYYEPFIQQMNRLYEVIKDQSLTQDDLDTAYRNTKIAFTALMQDTFDYSELQDIMKFYQSLDLSLYTVESRDRLITAMETVEKELDSPSLFRTGNDLSIEQYHQIADEHIGAVKEKFASTVRALEIDPTVTTLTASQLQTAVRLYEASVPTPLITNRAALNRFHQAVNIANNSAPQQIQNAYRNVTEAYQDLIKDCIDLSPVTAQTDRFNSLNASDYSAKSFLHYTESVQLLQEKCDGTFLFYFSAKETGEEMQTQITNHIASLVKPVETSYTNLVPMQTYQTLHDLCDRYRDATATDGLEIKLNRLLSSVKDGDEILLSDTAKPAAFERAIDEIKSAADDLDLGERFLQQEKENQVKHDENLVRLVIFCTMLALAATLACACFFSSRLLGRLDWTK